MPASAARAVIRHREDFAASALHEIAHWCIAGRARRQLVDYGYWYRPPPCSEAEQQVFYAVEARTQALERIFAEGCGCEFRISPDNLEVANVDVFGAVIDTETDRLKVSILARARRFLDAAFALRRAQASHAVVSNGEIGRG